MTNHKDFVHLTIKKHRLHWSKHPLKTNEWYELQKKRRTRLEIAKELDISYDDSVEGAVYTDFTNLVRVKPLEYDPSLKTYTSWDFGRDSNALIFWQKDFASNRLFTALEFSRQSTSVRKTLSADLLMNLIEALLAAATIGRHGRLPDANVRFLHPSTTF